MDTIKRFRLLVTDENCEHVSIVEDFATRREAEQRLKLEQSKLAAGSGDWFEVKDMWDSRQEYEIIEG